MLEDKEALRRHYRAVRRGLSVNIPTHHFFDSDISAAPSEIIAGYFPVAGEASPLNILSEAAQKGHQTALPVINGDQKILQFFLWGDGQALSNNYLNIPEPVHKMSISPDIIIVPLLAFDKHGTRLGQGGGYYDATIAHLRREKYIKVIGLAFDEQEAENALPRETHDQALDWIITPSRVIAFK